MSNGKGTEMVAAAFKAGIINEASRKSFIVPQRHGGR
jgi:hypothetical protein